MKGKGEDFYEQHVERVYRYLFSLSGDSSPQVWLRDRKTAVAHGRGGIKEDIEG